MIDAVQILWSPAGVTMPSLGSKALVDVTDGDTPNIRMPVRMLSVDTPEVTAGSPDGARRVDEKFGQLAEWIRQGRAPISAALAELLLPRIDTGRAGSLHFEQGTLASAFSKQNIETRLVRPDGSRRGIFVRIGEQPFDDNGRLLAYVAPNYSEAERATMSRAQRATFNLDLVQNGWAAPFVIYPAVPGELDLPLFLQAAADAVAAGRGIWADQETLLAYEYRAVEKLHTITRSLVEGTELTFAEAHAWRERYCVDMRTRTLHGPEDYFAIPPVYRLWIWPGDVQEAVSRLNLVPAAQLVGAR